MRTIDGKPEYRNGLVSDGVWEGNTIWSPQQFKRSSSVILGVPFQLGGVSHHFGGILFPVIGGRRRNPGHFEEISIILGSFPGIWEGSQLLGGRQYPCHF